MIIRTASVFAGASLVLLGACASKPAPITEGTTTTETVVEEVRTVDTGNVDDASVGQIVQTPALGDRVYFDLNGDALDTDDQSLLRQHALKYTSDPSVRILVAGNCDERGTREYNLALGERRAAKVKDYLVSLGIAPNRIDTISYGKERPIAAESNEQAWAMNRNGFIQVVSPNS
ncbi:MULTISPECIES: OmpA family protein [Hyphomonas]|uniref:Peptidoglycan-associated lipoprotein n=2 Tax=Hyphomonas adhaerens TaxID=81029 RepID=A0A069E3I1_9PROT|nr:MULTISPECIES: OmpA family protein [Hyphomonas]KCZ84690.1 OmpA family protein [Hyphomonas adhaerens MHS-3]